MTETAEAPPTTGAARSARWVWVLELLALLPIAATLVDVLSGPHLQYLDYWQILLKFYNPDASLNSGGFFALRNEHPVALPALAYWLNVLAAHGDNRTLGCVVVVVGALTVLVLRAALPRSLPPAVRAGLVVAASALLFSPHGLHNFVRSMSGMAWLTANLLVVATLLLARRGCWVGAWAVGLVACLTYGTGFPVWVALAWFAWVRREAVWKRVVPLVVLAAIFAVWSNLDPGVEPGQAPSSDPSRALYTFLSAVGHLWTANNAGMAVVAGVAILVAYGLLLTTRGARDPELRVWWALALHALLACGMIGVSRIDFGPDYGIISRYASQSALMALPLLVIAGWLLVRWSRANTPRVAVVAVAAGVLGFALGVPTAIGLRDEMREVPLQAIALRAGLTDAYPVIVPKGAQVRRLLPQIDHYPFTPDFTLGCGGPELGDRIDVDDAERLSQADKSRRRDPSGFVEGNEQLDGATVVRGWATGLDDPIHCAVVVDGDGEVVGGGIVNQTRVDVSTKLNWLSGRTGFAVVGPTVTDETRVVFVRESGRLLWLPAEPESGGDR